MMERRSLLGPRARRVLAVLGVLATLLASAWFVLSMPATYRAERQVLFLVPPTVDPPEKVNPFLAFSPSVSTALSVIVLTLSDDSTVDEVAPEGSGSEYEVVASTSTLAPVMVIEALSDQPAKANAVADRLVDLSGERLDSQQESAGAPKSTWITTSLIASSAVPERVWKDQLRAGAILLAGGLALTAILVGSLARIERRSRGRDVRPSDSHGHR